MTFAALAPPKGKTLIAAWLTNDPAVLFGSHALASGGLDVIADEVPIARD